MTAIKFNYSGVEAVKSNLEETIGKIEELTKNVKSSKETMTANWSAQEAVEFYNHVDKFVQLLSDFKTKYDTYTAFLEEAVTHYHSEEDSFVAAINSISGE